MSILIFHLLICYNEEAAGVLLFLDVILSNRLHFDLQKVLTNNRFCAIMYIVDKKQTSTVKKKIKRKIMTLLAS